MEDGFFQQKAEISDEDRQQVADGTLSVVKEDSGRFYSLETELDPGVEPELDDNGEVEDEGVEPAWEDDWQLIRELK